MHEAQGSRCRRRRRMLRKGSLVSETDAVLACQIESSRSPLGFLPWAYIPDHSDTSPQSLTMPFPTKEPRFPLYLPPSAISSSAPQPRTRPTAPSKRFIVPSKPLRLAHQSTTAPHQTTERTPLLIPPYNPQPLPPPPPPPQQPLVLQPQRPATPAPKPPAKPREAQNKPFYRPRPLW